MLPFKRRTGVSLLYDIKNFYIFVAFFIRPFYKMMLGKKIDLVDMESVVCTLSVFDCSFATSCLNDATVI
jgi:hypothetical protein